MNDTKEKDKIGLKQFKAILENPALVAQMTAEDLGDRVNQCRRCINQVRTGGRSTPLLAFAVILWYARERWSDLEMELDMEECLAVALRLCLDPSFVQPEWLICFNQSEAIAASG